jgi:hypothetical protein
VSRRADTLLWRGVISADNPEGLNLTDLGGFLRDAAHLAEQVGTWDGIGAAVPIVLVNRDSTIRHLWVGVERRWRPGR